MNVALAAIAVNRGELFPPCDTSGVEQPFPAQFPRPS